MAEQRPITRIAVARIHALRKQRGITAETLAEGMTQAGYRVDRTWITKAETGDREQISVDWLMAAADVLGVPASALISKPNCMACQDTPPPGFACTTCGATTARA